MKKYIKTKILCATVIFLSLLLSAMTGCSSKGENILSAGNSSVSISYYELLLSRIKGELARTGYEVDSDEFWNSDSGVDGKTVEEYYNWLILENCKTSMAALKIFDDMGLVLPKSALEEIDEEIAFYIDYDGNNSKKEFESILSPFGVNINTLREAYIVEAKISYLKSSVYGEDGKLIGAEVKNEFYKDNYNRFKQILITNYYYEYVTDSFGNEIYFDTNGGKILYDKENGQPLIDNETGKYVRDADGNIIYYDDEGSIVYDKENGIRKAKEDKDGNTISHKYTSEEMEERTASLKEEISKVSSGDISAFEELISKYSKVETAKYKDGYYVSEINRGTYEESMVQILDKLNEMEVGEIAMLEDEYGLRYIMKLELEDKAYEDSVYSELFESFAPELIEKMFFEKCSKELDNIKVDESALSKARSIKEIGVNFNY